MRYGHQGMNFGRAPGVGRLGKVQGPGGLSLVVGAFRVGVNP